jgi:molecular chaperone DnaK (HSP70)
MSIDVVKFDYDICKKVDEILEKHNFKPSLYTNYIKKMEKDFKNDMKSFCDDYGENFCIELKDYLPYKKYKKVLNWEPADIIEIDAGFITDVYLPDKIEHSTTYLFEPEWSGENIETLEDLDKQLTEFENRIKEYYDFISTPEFNSILKSMKDIQKIKDDHEEKVLEMEYKLKKQIEKFVKMKKDFI